MAEEEKWVPLRAGFGGKIIGRAQIDLETGLMTAEIYKEVAHILKEGLSEDMYSLSFEGRAATAEAATEAQNKLNAYFAEGEESMGHNHQPEDYVAPPAPPASTTTPKRDPYRRENRKLALEQAVIAGRDLHSSTGDYGKLITKIAGQFEEFLNNGTPAEDKTETK